MLAICLKNKELDDVFDDLLLCSGYLGSTLLLESVLDSFSLVLLKRVSEELREDCLVVLAVQDLLFKLAKVVQLQVNVRQDLSRQDLAKD